MDAFTFWTQHEAPPALEIVRSVVGRHVRLRQEGTYKGHHLILVAFEKDFDLSAVEPELRRRLDAIEWQFVTTGEDPKPGNRVFPCFGIAPIIKKSVAVAYHATRACVIPSILTEGLLPSNGERSATGFPDTAGVIHVCEKLTCNEGENDSAEWWKEHLSKRNRFDDPHWGIVQIDMARLRNARVYQDMHSASGLIVDKVDRIPKELITVVRGRCSA
jgi:hypothetical protein